MHLLKHLVFLLTKQSKYLSSSVFGKAYIALTISAVFLLFVTVQNFLTSKYELVHINYISTLLLSSLFFLINTVNLFIFMNLTFVFKGRNIFERQSHRDSGKQGENAPQPTSQMVPTARLVRAKARSSGRSPIPVSGALRLENPELFQVLHQGAGSEVNKPEREPAPVWRAGVSGSDLTLYQNAGCKPNLLICIVPVNEIICHICVSVLGLFHLPQ